MCEKAGTFVVYVGEVVNANAYPPDYRGAIWPAGPAGAG
jgi:hypothetical protein